MLFSQTKTKTWCTWTHRQPLLAWFFWANSNFWPPWTIVSMVQKGILAVLENGSISETGEAMANQNWCTCMWHRCLLAWIFWSNCDRLNFLMTMDYSPLSKREIWPFWRQAKRSKISETREAMPPKLVYMHVTSMHTCMNFLSRFWLIKFFDDHGLQSMVWKGNLVVFESSNISKPHPPKLVHMHVSLTPTCMNLLSRFWLI